jgi:hypothetical protein
MFGRRKTPFSANVSSPPPPPPSGNGWPPFRKMDAALDAAIRLFSRALEQAGQEVAGLSLPGPPPTSVAALLSDCIVYAGEDGPEFLTLGTSEDFKAFAYQPHCRLFLIINAALILEDLPLGDLRSDIAVSQVPRPLIDAHMMKRWISFIRPTGEAMTGDKSRLIAIMQRLRADTLAVGRLAPEWISQRVDIQDCSAEYCSGFPASIGRPLTPEVKRINNLPMTDFVEGLITQFLVETQMRGLSEQRRTA